MNKLRFEPQTSKTKQQISSHSYELLLSLENFGYKVSCTKTCLHTDPKSYKYNYPTDWNASNKEKGIKLSIAQGNPTTTQFFISYRTKHGSYLKLTDGYFGLQNSINTSHSSNLSNNLVEKMKHAGVKTKEHIINWLSDLEGEKDVDNWKSLSDLPKPFEFCTAYTKETSINAVPIFGGNPTTNTTVRMINFFSELETLGPVVITNKLHATSVGIEQPNANIWFVIQGKVINENGLTNQWILVNADITGYYALTKKNNGEFKITPNMKPNNGTVNFHRVSVIDKEMIQRAVKSYVLSIVK